MKKKEVGEYLRKNKVWLIIVAIILIMIIGIAGTKIFLYFNVVVGNDVLINLNTDKHFISLRHNQSSEVSFEASVRANPFCEVRCNTFFEDVSNAVPIEEDTILISPGSSIKKSYEINSPEKSIGLSMTCYSENSFLCQAKESSARSSIVVVEYNFTEGELSLQKEFRSSIEESFQRVNGIHAKLTQSLNAFNLFKENNQITFLEERRKVIQNQQEILDKDIASLIEEEASGDFRGVWEKSTELQLKTSALREETENYESTLKENIALYNTVVDGINEIKLNINSINYTFLSNESGIAFNTLMKEFNELISNKSLTTVQEKENTVSIIKQNISTLKITNETNVLDFLNVTSEMLVKIQPYETNISKVSLTFKEPTLQCPIRGRKETCCTEETCKSTNFPIVFVHGHAVSQSTSAEYSLEGFNKIQEKLDEQGYINAGTVTLYTQTDIPAERLSWFNTSFSVRASYYFDVIKDPEGQVILQTKSENIDAYAIRLKEIIEKVKTYTGKEKVKIVSFSMGGLVTRRYVQLFGSDNVDALILLGTPNHGIDGEVLALCPITGEEKECADMNSGSLFINKLNTGEKPSIPVHNIYGTGCEMITGKGDGAVLEESARLEWADNYVINGACQGKFSPLHLDLLNTELYPEVYQTIIKILESN